MGGAGLGKLGISTEFMGTSTIKGNLPTAAGKIIKQSIFQLVHGLDTRESTVSILDWWKSQETKLPKLAKVARRVLSIPASSTASERAFSAAGLTVSQSRTALDSETVNTILFIHSNKRAAEHQLHLGLNS